MTKDKPNDLDILDEVSHQAALADAEHGRSSADDQKWSRALGTVMEARLAELRRNLTPAEAPTERAKPIRPSLLAMARDALIEAINRITQVRGGAVQYAHRELRGLTDDDLRRLLDTLEPDPTNAE